MAGGVLLSQALRLCKAAMPAHAGMFLEDGIEHWEAVNRVNYLGVVYTLKAVVPSMVQRNSGRIIVTNSSGSFMGRKPSRAGPIWSSLHGCQSHSCSFALSHEEHPARDFLNLCISLYLPQL